MSTQAPSERIAFLIEAAKRPDGVTVDDLKCALKLGWESANCSLKHYAQRGGIFRSTAWGADGRRHYFDTPERAAEWSARNFGHQRRIVAVQRDQYLQRLSEAKQPPKPQPVNGKLPEVQRAPVVYGDKRYQLQPGDPVPSIFRKLPLGATLYGMSA